DRRFSKPLFHIIIFCLAVGEIEPPTIIVDCNGDVIRILERSRTAVERGVIEVPFRRSNLPDEFREIVPVFVVALTAALRGEVILVPPLELSARRQRYFARFLAADQIAAYRNQRLAPLRPQRGDNVG